MRASPDGLSEPRFVQRTPPGVQARGVPRREIGAGRAVAGHPLHRTGRAASPHPAPALGYNAKPHQWIRMTDMGLGQPPRRVRVHARPRQPPPPAPRERLPPEPRDAAPKGPQRPSVHRRPVVAGMAENDRPQIPALGGKRPSNASGYATIQNGWANPRLPSSWPAGTPRCYSSGSRCARHFRDCPREAGRELARVEDVDVPRARTTGRVRSSRRTRKAGMRGDGHPSHSRSRSIGGCRLACL